LPKPALAWGFIPSFEIGLKWEATVVEIAERRLIFTGIRRPRTDQRWARLRSSDALRHGCPLNKFPRYEIE
jgi:hypothetical protein